MIITRRQLREMIIREVEGTSDRERAAAAKWADLEETFVFFKDKLPDQFGTAFLRLNLPLWKIIADALGKDSFEDLRYIDDAGASDEYRLDYVLNNHFEPGGEQEEAMWKIFSKSHSGKPATFPGDARVVMGLINDSRPAIHVRDSDVVDWIFI